MTEATGAFAQLEPEEHDPGGPREHLLTSAGRAYPWAEVRVVDLVTEQDVAPGEPGEIWTRSAQNMVGYFERPEETAQALTADGWLRTGDVGTRDAEGYLFLLDRKKELIISGGENVYPAEVEGALAAHPDVAEVAIFGVPSEKWGETVKAAVVPRPGHTVTAESVIAFARERLAAFKCPTSVDVVAALPRTVTGKITKDVLREPYWTGFSRRIN
jgi:long-chain acyl-CoA synthetase